MGHFFGETNTGHFREGIDAGGNGGIEGVVGTESILNGGDTVSRGGMGQKELAVGIANGIDTLGAGFHLVVGGNKARFVDGNSNTFKADPLGCRATSH